MLEDLFGIKAPSAAKILLQRGSNPIPGIFRTLLIINLTFIHDVRHLQPLHTHLVALHQVMPTFFGMQLCPQRYLPCTRLIREFLSQPSKCLIKCTVSDWWFYKMPEFVRSRLYLILHLELRAQRKIVRIPPCIKS